MQEILTIGRYFKRKFGVKVYKAPISIMGFTCPNIDGTIAKGGCIYCENESFSPNISKEQRSFKLNLHTKDNPHLNSQLLQLESQYKKTKTKLAKKFNAKKFIVYFQSFTNTYAPFSTLKALYDKAFELEDAIGISIGTRSDCVSEEVLRYLKIKKDEGKEVWIEYGVQSIYNQTLEYINRGHTIENVIEWIEKTKEYGLNVCVHVIFGLPNETEEMMLNSFKLLCDLHVNSIKIHPLYITKNTRLANEYKSGNFTPMSEEKYLDILVKAVQMMPKDIVLQRITAGVPNDSLLAPKWCYEPHAQKNSAKNALLKAGFLY
ncbi:MAG: TIGR01212 family radical SAM protein [Campylobacteraceae bacterium]|nr:TIGR01212 family radical SAM protein [Campylobacteraceae bacterium]